MISRANHNTPISMTVKAGEKGAIIKNVKIRTSQKWWADSESYIGNKVIIDGEPLILGSTIDNSSYIKDSPVIVNSKIRNSTVTHYCYVENSNVVGDSRLVGEHKVVNSVMIDCDLDGSCKVFNSKLRGVLARNNSVFDKCKFDGYFEFWKPVHFENVTMSGVINFYEVSSSGNLVIKTGAKEKEYKNPNKLVYKLKNITIKGSDDFANALGLEEIV